MSVELPWLLVLVAVGLIALIYASVGHGGASGYIAVLVLAGFGRPDITPLVLVLNMAVSGIAWVAYTRAGHFSGRLLVPFAVTSVPAAMVGASLSASPRAYAIVLGSTLVLASLRFLVLSRPTRRDRALSMRALWTVAPVVGALLGTVAGMVGVGGGIFLSPLLLVMGWADAKETGAVSAAFIFVNSLSGFAAQMARGGHVSPDMAGPLLLIVIACGVVGASMGANRFSYVFLQRLLGGVLGLAGGKLLFGVS